MWDGSQWIDPASGSHGGSNSSGNKTAKTGNPFVDVNEGNYFYEPDAE